MTKPFDPLALRVGLAYRRGLAAYVEAGKLLAEKKAALNTALAALARGERRRLRVRFDRTAQRLMKLARRIRRLASDFVLDAKDLRQRLWGTPNPLPPSNVLPASLS